MTNDKTLTQRYIAVDTSPYYSSHLKEPRGRGGWAFAFGSRNAEPWFAPGSLTYAEARTYAKTRARQQGYRVIYVLP